MASNPRINSALVMAIRMARSAGNSSNGPPKSHGYRDNDSRPDKCFTTSRAVKTGKANACSGKIFVTSAPDHFGPITAENDPTRGQGVLVGEYWEDRMECRQWGAHLPHVAGIAGQSDYGSQSVALSGGYEDDEDHGEWFLYTGRWDSHTHVVRNMVREEEGGFYHGTLCLNYRTCECSLIAVL